jgi:hypothetical protein
LAYGVIWPSTLDQINAVTVRFMAGYGSRPLDCPPQLKRAMLEDIGSMYESREDVIVGQGYAISEMPRGSSVVYSAFRTHPLQR